MIVNLGKKPDALDLVDFFHQMALTELTDAELSRLFRMKWEETGEVTSDDLSLWIANKNPENPNITATIPIPDPNEP